MSTVVPAGPGSMVTWFMRAPLSNSPSVSCRTWTALPAREQFGGRERLDEIVVGARLQALDRGFLPGPGGQQQDRNIRGTKVRAQRRDELKAAEAGHHHIADEDVRRIGPGGFQRRLPVGDGRDLVAWPQQPLQILAPYLVTRPPERRVLAAEQRQVRVVIQEAQLLAPPHDHGEPGGQADAAGGAQAGRPIPRVTERRIRPREGAHPPRHLAVAQGTSAPPGWGYRRCSWASPLTSCQQDHVTDQRANVGYEQDAGTANRRRVAARGRESGGHHAG